MMGGLDRRCSLNFAFLSLCLCFFAIYFFYYWNPIFSFPGGNRKEMGRTRTEQGLYSLSLKLIQDWDCIQFKIFCSWKVNWWKNELSLWFDLSWLSWAQGGTVWVWGGSGSGNEGVVVVALEIAFCSYHLIIIIIISWFITWHWNWNRMSLVRSWSWDQIKKKLESWSWKLKAVEVRTNFQSGIQAGDFFLDMYEYELQNEQVCFASTSFVSFFQVYKFPLPGMEVEVEQSGMEWSGGALELNCVEWIFVRDFFPNGPGPVQKSTQRGRESCNFWEEVGKRNWNHLSNNLTVKLLWWEWNSK